MYDAKFLLASSKSMANVKDAFLVLANAIHRDSSPYGCYAALPS